MLKQDGYTVLHYKLSQHIKSAFRRKNESESRNLMLSTPTILLYLPIYHLKNEKYNYLSNHHQRRQIFIYFDFSKLSNSKIVLDTRRKLHRSSDCMLLMMLGQKNLTLHHQFTKMLLYNQKVVILLYFIRECFFIFLSLQSLLNVKICLYFHNNKTHISINEFLDKRHQNDDVAFQ